MLITLALSKPRSSKAGAQVAQAILQELAKWNAKLVRAGVVPPLTRLMKQDPPGMVYRREDGESWVDAAYAYRQGWADCSNLTTWWVGELIAKGEPATIHIRWRRYADGKRLYHVLVRRGDGRIQDPSRLLGM